MILGVAYYQSNQIQILADRTATLRHLNQQLTKEVDQRREAEEAIRLYEQAVEASGDLVIVLDRDHVYRIVNTTYLEYHQLKRADIVGKTPAEIVGEKFYIKQIKPTLERCLAGETVSTETKFHYPLLGERNLSGRMFPLRNEQNQIIGVVTIARDITEQVNLEQQYQQAQKIESIGRLAGGIAHDFNNLLVPIIGYVELALMDLSAENKLYDDLTIVRRAAERGANLTRQILAFSRKQVLSMEIVDLNEVVEAFQKMIQRLIGENIELQTFLTPSPYAINADRGQLEQVLMNLVINARDAIPNGGKLTIETSNTFLDEDYVKKYADAQPPGHYVMLSVSDTGQGMDAETRKQIFEPFFTTKEAGKGTGLGLATVFGIIKQHGGNIWVYSEVGNGTTFKIYLPRAEQTVKTNEAIAQAESSLYGVETVLVVEDEEMVRNLICESLQAHGYQTIEARNPQEAVQQVANHQGTIHLLLTDVIMPGMNGRELQQQLAAIRPDIRTLYMSGYTDNVIVHHGILYEGVNFLQKPFTIHKLLGKVRQTLS
jgi:PAS domain S-box-containing protein